ncbi:ZIP metal ion transporter family [Perilla frutescens var. hirtella]|uniref:ZIP metal ion transporter family n=1 Tax=Perilla frutescens var. hirtella TaxID=608512 RepID=A0AAD4P9R4_PERFH|nr:ZIP metal ion transporter family [Perilla frutescens var. hirtella]
MRAVSDNRRQIYCCLFGVLAVVGFGLSVAAAHQCSHGHHHHHHHDEDVGLMKNNQGQQQTLLPEEIAEEEDLLRMWGHDDHDHELEHGHHEHDGDVELSGLGLWIKAMGCSLLVSLASLICLILLPLIFTQGKPSKAIVDSLALFGAGAMLGDAFLHQLPHAFGGEHSHSHDQHNDHHHEHSGHSHSLKDLSVGLSILAGIVVFLIVEKLVRYIEEFSGGVNDWSHGHHHHHKHSNKLKDDDHVHENHQAESHDEKSSEGKELDTADKAPSGKTSEKDSLRKRTTGTSAPEDLHAEKISNGNVEFVERNAPIKSQSSLVFGYLNLFSDGVHNFTDGMALGSAFLLYGSVGGWSRTLFLLAHELPQEIGDFGILVRSGFSVSKALFFNFLSALAALAGTALALMWGRDPGQSSLIEGFTAGGFMYIALAGVLAEMNNGTSALRNTLIQLISLLLGMGVALCISLVE